MLNNRVFLDDERATPEGWVRVYWPDEAIELLETNAVAEISLDHDLGDDERGTGYDVVLWIEEAVALQGFTVVYAASIVHSPKLPSHDFGKIERGLPHSCHTILHAKPHLHHNGDQIVIISSAV